jgi:GNAT superfamily N-acetyltransferase
MAEIRTPLFSEKNQWLPLWRGYIEFYEVTLSEEITKLSWERFHNAKEPVHILAAYENGEMAGFSTFVFHRSTWAKNYHCYLEDLFIAEKFRRKGMAKQLIMAVGDAARHGGADRLYWNTRKGNKVAIAVYEKLAVQSDFLQYRMSIFAPDFTH